MKLSVEGKGFDPQQVEQVHQPAHTVDTVAENDRPALQIQEQIFDVVSQSFLQFDIFFSGRHFYTQESTCIDTKVISLRIHTVRYR